jgi:hypothetical protein
MPQCAKRCAIVLQSLRNAAQSRCNRCETLGKRFAFARFLYLSISNPSLLTFFLFFFPAAIKDDKRMTKDQFIKQNKGISSDGDLPEDVLGGIYDRIQAQVGKRDDIYVFCDAT